MYSWTLFAVNWRKTGQHRQGAQLTINIAMHSLVACCPPAKKIYYLRSQISVWVQQTNDKTWLCATKTVIHFSITLGGWIFRWSLNAVTYVWTKYVVNKPWHFHFFLLRPSKPAVIGMPTDKPSFGGDKILFYFAFTKNHMLSRPRVIFFQFKLLRLGARVLFGHVKIASVGCAYEFNLKSRWLRHDTSSLMPYDTSTPSYRRTSKMSAKPAVK